MKARSSTPPVERPHSTDMPVKLGQCPFPCCKPSDASRSDGLCSGHGLKADYRRTGNRNLLPNGGHCKDGVVGFLCFGPHHKECPEWKPPVIKQDKPKPRSAHEQAMGVDQLGA